MRAWAEVNVDHETPTDAGAVTVSGLDASGIALRRNGLRDFEHRRYTFRRCSS